MSRYAGVKTRYEVEKQIIERFAEGLITRDLTLIQEAAANAEDRLAGVCFCSAYDESECVCGAWEK